MFSFTVIQKYFDYFFCNPMNYITNYKKLPFSLSSVTDYILKVIWPNPDCETADNFIVRKKPDMQNIPCMPEIFKTLIAAFIQQQQHYIIEFKNHFVFRQNDYSEQLSTSQISRHTRRYSLAHQRTTVPTTSLSLRACWLWCVIMHHRANVSPVSQPLSTLSASASQSSSTARARPHDDWREAVGCSFSPQSCSHGAAHDPLWSLYSNIGFSVTVTHQVIWSGLVFILVWDM